MPKKYIYKKRGKTQNYEKNSLEKAVAAVKKGELSIRKASELFNVPKSTIGDRISGKYEVHVKNGRPAHIPIEIEEKIVQAVVMAARRGVGLTCKQVLARTKVLCNRLNIGKGFKTFRAGKDWWQGVKKRHPEVSMRKPEKLTTHRSRMMNREVFNKYFNDLETITEGLNLTQKPMLIWNCDEMSKNFEHDPVRVVAAKGEACVSRTSTKSTNITVMACVNASGQRMPPMFVVKGKTPRSLRGFNTSSAPKGSVWCHQENGWMNDAIGERWFDEVFLKYCGPERPQLLILDGHSSHETLGILMRAMEENVHILALPPHTTHCLQPLDRSVFGPLNRKYNEVCSGLLQENPLHQINKWTFCGLFNEAWDHAVTELNICSGFRACGIHPLDRTAVPESAFAPSQPTDRPLNDTTNVATPEPGTNLTSGSNESTMAETMEHRANMISAANVELHTLSPVLSHDITESSEILDISNPGELLSLILDGNVQVDPLTDVNGNQLILDTQRSVLNSIGNADFIATPCLDSQIESAFLPPTMSSAPAPTSSSKVTKKRITHHRLLTSADIIEEKLLASKIKEEKENKRKYKAFKN